MLHYKFLIVFITLVYLTNKQISCLVNCQSKQIKVIKSLDEIEPKVIESNSFPDSVVNEMFLNASLEFEAENNTNENNRLPSLGMRAARMLLGSSSKSKLKLKAPSQFCPFSKKPACNFASRYRTIDGSCNNFENPLMGSSKTMYKRLLKPIYNDGREELRYKSFTGKKLPNPRLVALKLHGPLNQFSSYVSNLSPHFAQFLSHDLSFIQPTADKDNKPIECTCENDNSNCLIVKIPKGDRWNDDQDCMATPRSSSMFKSFECDLDEREQFNARTSWFDLSQVYGHNAKLNHQLRLFKDGLMKTGKTANKKFSYLPYDTKSQCGPVGQNCFHAGDDRVNQNLALVSMHTIFLRLHNTIAIELHKLNPEYNDEILFQEARKMNIGIYTHIIYNELIPVIIGPEVSNIYGLIPLINGYSDSYDPRVSGQMGNEFVTAAFRFGHSLVQKEFSSPDSHLVPDNVKISLDKMIFNTKFAFTDKINVDTFVRSCMFDRAGSFDTHINDVLENHLFENKDNAIKRLSLATLNILRGRDHALRPYNDYRELCGLNRANSFADLINIPEETRIRLAETYDNIDDVDLFSGGTSEIPIEGGVVGATFACIIGKQYSDLKRADRFFYENFNTDIGFTLEQLNEIRKVTMAQVLCDTSDVKKVQKNAFLLFDDLLNPYINCENIQNQINFRLWDLRK